jgi:agmatine deiminase
VAPTALLLGWRAEVADVLAAVARAAPPDLLLLVLASESDRETVAATLGPTGARLHVLPVAVGTPWVRDYGPLLAAADDGTVLVDAGYLAQRAEDDAVPARLAERWGARRVTLPLSVEGGNLIADGRGRCFSTPRILERNPERSEDEVRAVLRDQLGCDPLVLLPRLRGEPTGHADVMVSFVAGRALVAAAPSEPRDGPLLDDVAAAVQAGVAHVGGATSLVRVPLVRSRVGDLLSWVQVVAAGDRLLVPDYAAEGEPARVAAAQATALEVLAAAFPEHRLVPIRLAPRAGLGGGLHCYTLGLP